jgi:hypothetical protein
MTSLRLGLEPGSRAVAACEAAEVGSPNTTVAKTLAALDELTKDGLQTTRP